MKMLAACAVAILCLQETQTFHIVVGRTLTEDHRRGIELGLAEAVQTAGLLGAAVTANEDHRKHTIGFIFAGTVISHAHVPVLHLDVGGRGPYEQACKFQVAAPPGRLTWQATLNRFGASELNERFVKKFGTPMTSDAWNAWFAVKALVENALRAPADADLCATLGRARFDGHKGQPLFFDPKTRVLQQPTYER